MVIWYEITKRPKGKISFPNDYVNIEKGRGKFGRVAYSRELTREEQAKYNLEEVN